MNIEYGRGNRTRKQISYADDMDDSQWLEMMEDKDEEGVGFNDKEEREEIKEKEEEVN